MGLQDILRERFGDSPETAPGAAEPLSGMAARASCRSFRPDPVDPVLIETIAAVALASPTKSDLQQRDILIVEDPRLRAELHALCGTQAWLTAAPHLLVFLANNRRQRLIHEIAGLPFANDHLDAFFNAAVDAAIALSACVTAAEALGLGTCPVSAIRNHPESVSRLLGLPDHVFPVAGLALGWPAELGRLSRRLPLAVTLHRDRYTEPGLARALSTYSRWRAESEPLMRQRAVERFGVVEEYGWIEDRARQYTLPERTGFGAFARAKGFRLE
jgi:nitroreductase